MWLEARHTEINLNFLLITGIAFTDLPVRQAHFQTTFYVLHKPMFRFNWHLAFIPQKPTENPLHWFKIRSFHLLNDDFLIEAKSFLFLHRTSQGFCYSGIQCSSDSSELPPECCVWRNGTYNYLVCTWFDRARPYVKISASWNTSTVHMYSCVTICGKAGYLRHCQCNSCLMLRFQKRYKFASWDQTLKHWLVFEEVAGTWSLLSFWLIKLYFLKITINVFPVLLVQAWYCTYFAFSHPVISDSVWLRHRV